MKLITLLVTLWRGFICNYNAQSFLRHNWYLNNSQICFRTYYLKIIVEKNTPPLPPFPHPFKILICYERIFHPEVALKFEDEDWSHVPFSQITFKIKISFLYVNWKLPGIFRFFTLPLKFQTKQSFTLRNFLRPKTKTPGNSTWFFLDHLWKF